MALAVRPAVEWKTRFLGKRGIYAMYLELATQRDPFEARSAWPVCIGPSFLSDLVRSMRTAIGEFSNSILHLIFQRRIEIFNISCI